MLHEFKDNKLVLIPDYFAIYGIYMSLSQVHWLHLESGLITTFPTKCLTFLVLELKINCWTVNTLPLHHLPVEDLVMPLYSAREVTAVTENTMFVCLQRLIPYFCTC